MKMGTGLGPADLSGLGGSMIIRSRSEASSYYGNLMHLVLCLAALSRRQRS